MISHSGQILYPAASYKNYRVLLQIMAFSRYICCNFD